MLETWVNNLVFLSKTLVCYRSFEKRPLSIKEDWVYEDPWKAVEKAFKNAFINGSSKDLLRGETLMLKQLSSNEYQTPTKKIEFYSSISKRWGISPILV